MRQCVSHFPDRSGKRGGAANTGLTNDLSLTCVDFLWLVSCCRAFTLESETFRFDFFFLSYPV